MLSFAIPQKMYKPITPPQLIILHHRKDAYITQWSVENRISPFWYVYWNRTPGAYITVGGRRIELTPDKVVFIPPLVSYSTGCDRPFTHSYFFLKHAEHPDTVFSDVFIFEADGKFLDAMNCSRDPEFNRLAIYSSILDFYCRAIKEHPQDNCAGFDRRIVKVIEEISMRSKEQCSNEALAAICGLSVSAFNHLFTRLVGIAPARYVTGVFLEKARHMLEDRSCTVEEAAQAAGYTDRYTFSHAYKKFYGVSPGAARKKAEPAEKENSPA